KFLGRSLAQDRDRVLVDYHAWASHGRRDRRDDPRSASAEPRLSVDLSFSATGTHGAESTSPRGVRSWHQRAAALEGCSTIQSRSAAFSMRLQPQASRTARKDPTRRETHYRTQHDAPCSVPTVRLT